MSDNQGIKFRINLALERAKVSQRELARELGKSSPAVSEMLTKPGEIDSMAYVEATSKLTGFSFERIRTGKGPEKEEASSIANEDAVLYLSGKSVRPLAVTVDKAGNENMVMVPVRAFAGYMRSYADPHYIGKLPAFSLPNFTDGTYRMFQVDGNSMLQLGGGGLHDGDIVIAKYVEDIFMMRDNRVYVVVSKEGVIVKRCFNRLGTEEKVLICNSDNKSGDYPPIILHPNEIMEVWELKAFISRQLSFNTDLYEVLSDLQAQQVIMKEKIEKIEKKSLPN